jgi:hypothetical protein
MRRLKRPHNGSTDSSCGAAGGPEGGRVVLVVTVVVGDAMVVVVVADPPDSNAPMSGAFPFHGRWMPALSAHEHDPPVNVMLDAVMLATVRTPHPWIWIWSPCAPGKLSGAMKKFRGSAISGSVVLRESPFLTVIVVPEPPPLARRKNVPPSMASEAPAHPATGWLTPVHSRRSQSA